MKKKKFKIFGERNSGTNYIQALICQNIPAADPLGVYEYGWKHSIPDPSFFHARKVHFPPLRFILVYRDLVPWLISLKRNTHQSKKEKAAAASMPMAVFISTEFEGYANPVELYRTKMQDLHRAQLADPSGSLIVRYDKLIQHPAELIGSIAEFLGEKPPEKFEDLDSYFTSGIRTKKKYDRTQNDPLRYAEEMGPDAMRLLAKMVKTE